LFWENVDELILEMLYDKNAFIGENFMLVFIGVQT